MDRTFKNIPEDRIQDADKPSFLNSLNWIRGGSWDDLLESKRILIISESGVGKTYECRQRSGSLWAAGEAAFFLELAALAVEDVRTLLSFEEESRLGEWLDSKSSIATFFLDSIDELKLTKASFRTALTKLRKLIGERLDRVRIVVTTRPTSFDVQLLRTIFPVPTNISSLSGEEAFARTAIRENISRKTDSSIKKYPDWRVVALMPLSDEQIIDVCRSRNVVDVEVLFEDLRRSNALDFARRPQDLIELCEDWKLQKRIRDHRDQIDTYVRAKLVAAEGREDFNELSLDKAIEGASRLALATQVMRRLTITHSSKQDIHDEEIAVDPFFQLSDWQPSMLMELLQRPLFSFASYGRVRFHHRSIAEYLTSERLYVLRKNGMSFRSLKRMLFAETRGNTIVRPSMRAVAAWLALKDQNIFELLKDNDPAVLLNYGDPASLTQIQRNETLSSYVRCYGSGGWRGLHTPQIQIHRFATRELAGEISKIWTEGVENPDVRETLINLIGAGRVTECADLVFEIAQDTGAAEIERVMAVEALAAIGDERLRHITTSMVNADELWPTKVVRSSVLTVFPRYMSSYQLCKIMHWIGSEKSNIGSFNWELSRLIKESDIDLQSLSVLRDELVTMMSEGVEWNDSWPHLQSNRSDLAGILAAACERALVINKDVKWFHASVIALRLGGHESSVEEPLQSLKQRLRALEAAENERLFWAEYSFIQSLVKISDPWNRLSLVVLSDSVCKLNASRDLDWIIAALVDTSRPEDDRAMLIEGVIFLNQIGDRRRDNLLRIKELVVDQIALARRVDESLKVSENEERESERQKEVADRKERISKRKEEDLESWRRYYREIVNNPDEQFSDERGVDTAWNLWNVMTNADGRASGWNRKFIEEQFNGEFADKLRKLLMNIWREFTPTLPSERAENERNSIYKIWQVGLAGIHAESEDPGWAINLSVNDAELAVRYALIELNDLPVWINILGKYHSSALDRVLGGELDWCLSRAPVDGGHSLLLQIISGGPEGLVRQFIPRLEGWLDADLDLPQENENINGILGRLRQITDVILMHGEDDERRRLRDRAVFRMKLEIPMVLSQRWMYVLMDVDPVLGVDKLSDLLEEIEPSKDSDAVMWFASIFVGPREEINLRDEKFTPALLLKLMRLAYRHIRIQDDTHHEGSYSPDTRDDAQQARSRIVTALLELKGTEGIAAKLEMASDPLCEHFKDRILSMAEESWAQEIDSEILDESAARALDRSGEAPAATSLSMFMIMKDRLADLDDLLLRDDSPREAWAKIDAERVMRREIARELRHASKSIYTVDQEAVTADEKETDIRLRSSCSMHEATIELKLGDNRTVTDLRDTLENQLVKKYMAAENSRAGALLVTLSRDREWKHPENGKKIGPEELLLLLEVEAKRLQNALGDGTYIYVHLLDLRPRLSTEADAKSR